MAIESEIQQNEEFTHRDTEEVKPEISSHIYVSVQNEPTKSEPYLYNNNNTRFYFSERVKRAGRASIFVAIVIVLFAGRFSVPDNEVSQVQDKVMDALEFANNFINTPGNEHYRDFFQAFCSFLLDVIFMITLGHWVLYGKNGRLPVSFAVFYGTRALVQAIWTTPFPEGNYWYSPGFPSLVVPYGRQSDFFFSGHSGFLVICASEWHKLKVPKLRNFIIGTAVYTILILLIYRTHYSIDVFTGVIFAEWCFWKADTYKDVIDRQWTYYMAKFKNMLSEKDIQLPCFDEEKYPLTSQV